MDIKEIDNILDEIIDKFMIEWIIDKNKNFIQYETLFKTKNYSKYHKELDNITKYSENFILQEVNEIVTKDSNRLLIKNVMLKYLMYYVYILIGLNYDDKMDDFNNNLVEINKLQMNNDDLIKIDNFYNIESIHNIIITVNLLKELINNDKNKSEELVNLINKIGEDKINELLKNKNKQIIYHNLIKIAIFINLFKIEEKKEMYYIVDKSETIDGEFMIIDIVVPKREYVDLEKINEILEPSQLETDIPNMIYDMLNDERSNDIYEIKKKEFDYDTKIQKLFETKMIIPITDDFLLYHKNNEKYEYQNENDRKKENTKIKYIVNKINDVANYNKEPEEIKKLFYAPQINRYATLVNKYENMKIINKMSLVTTMNKNLELQHEFMSFMEYPNIPFKYLNNHNFMHLNMGESYNVIRNSSFVMRKYNNNVETRVLSYGMMTNIIGFALTMDYNIDQLSPNDFIIIDNEDPLSFAEKIFKEKINRNTKNKTIKKNYILFFDKTKKYKLAGYDDNLPQNDIIKKIKVKH